MSKKHIFTIIAIVVVIGLGLIFKIGSGPSEQSTQPSPSTQSYGGLVDNKNPIYTQGLRASEYAVQVIDALGKLVGPIFSDKGGVPTVSGTSVATTTAANLCGGHPLINAWFATATGTLALPDAGTLKATTHCLNNDGDMVQFSIRNASTSGDFVILGNTSTTLRMLSLSSSTTSQYSTGTSTLPFQRTAHFRAYKITSSTGAVSEDWVIVEGNIY